MKIQPIRGNFELTAMKSQESLLWKNFIKLVLHNRLQKYLHLKIFYEKFDFFFSHSLNNSAIVLKLFVVWLNSHLKKLWRQQHGRWKHTFERVRINKNRWSSLSNKFFIQSTFIIFFYSSLVIVHFFKFKYFAIEWFYQVL